MGHSGKAGENIFWAMNRNKPGIIKRILNALERFIARIRGKDTISSLTCLTLLSVNFAVPPGFFLFLLYCYYTAFLFLCKGQRAQNSRSEPFISDLSSAADRTAVFLRKNVRTCRIPLTTAP